MVQIPSKSTSGRRRGRRRPTLSRPHKMPTDPPSRLRRCAILLCSAVFVAAVSHFAGSRGNDTRSELAAAAARAGGLGKEGGTTPPALRKQLRDMARFDVLAARVIAKLQRETSLELHSAARRTQPEGKPAVVPQDVSSGRPDSPPRAARRPVSVAVPSAARVGRPAAASGHSKGQAREVILADDEGGGAEEAVMDAEEGREGEEEGVKDEAGGETEADVGEGEEEGQGLDENPNALQGGENPLRPRSCNPSSRQDG